MTITALSADKGIPKSQLDTLSKQTALPLLSPQISADYLLHISTEYLSLKKVLQASNKANKKKPKFESIHIDFVTGKSNHRRLHGGGKGQDLAKAIGFHKIKDPTILDLTAGMGGDSFVFASLGATVTMVERNVVIHALLQDALARMKLSADSELQTIFHHLNLIHGNALSILRNINEDAVYEESINENTMPDVIYLDPMFPSRSKSAQVKKEMQFFHDIVGEDNDSEEILLKALSCAKKRIVVKRPRLAENLTEKVQVDFAIMGKSTRYDVYLPRRQPI